MGNTDAAIESTLLKRYTALHRIKLCRQSKIMSDTPPAFEVKSTSIDLLSLVLKNAEPQMLQQTLQARFGKRDASAERFVLDLGAFSAPQQVDLATILSLATQYGIRFVALRHQDDGFAALARQYQLAYYKPATNNRVETIAPEKPAVAETPAATAMIIDKPVRAGQQIYAQHTDLIVLDIVSAGAEVIADGNIHIYAPLRGRALAGARGDKQTRIFTQSMQAELVSIAGVYRTMEQALPTSIQNKPTQIHLEQERLVMTALGN